MRNMLKSCVAATVLAAAAISVVPETAVAGPVGLSSPAGVSLTSPTKTVAWICRRVHHRHWGYYGYARPAYYGYAAPAYYGYAAAPSYYGYGGGGCACPGYYGSASPYGYYGWGGGLGAAALTAATLPFGVLGGWWW